MSSSLFPVLVLALAACGSPTSSAGPGDPAGSGASPAAAASSADWSGVDPCSLVPEGSRTGLGLGVQATPIGGPAPSCRFTAAQRSATGFSAGTQLILGGSFDEVVTNVERGQTVPRTDIDVAGRKAAQFEGGDVICTIVVEASGSTAVSVIGTDGCDAARKVVETAVANGPGA